MLFIKKLTNQEKTSFSLHFIYSMLDGIMLGILALNEFVFIKSLNGDDYSLSVLFQFSMLVFIFLVFINEFIRREPNKKKMLRITGLITRFPLIALIFFPAAADAYSSHIFHFIFLGIFLIYFLGNTIIYPLINLFLKNTYRHENFGKLYGYASSANKIVMLIVTFFYGLLLDIDYYAFRYILIIAGIISIISIHLLSLIPYKPPEQKVIKKKISTSVMDSIRRMVQILKENKAFRDFEIGFMFYGFSFMITVSVIVIFLNKGISLNYTSYAVYKNFYNILAIILLPLTGKWLGKTDPRIFAMVTFGSLTLYIFFMMLTAYFPSHYIIWGIDIYVMLVLSYIAYGVFAATMALLWFIGSAYFCKDEEAADYQAVHLSLTGIRAIFAPALGVFFFNIIGYTWTFLIAIISLLAGIAVLWKSYLNKTS